MRDSGLVCMGGLVVAAYAIYMGLGPGGDGYIFATILMALGALAGVKFERYQVRKSLISDKNPGENVPGDDSDDEPADD